mgnify:CR=1 FL=1
MNKPKFYELEVHTFTYWKIPSLIWIELTDEMKRALENERGTPRTLHGPKEFFFMTNNNKLYFREGSMILGDAKDYMSHIYEVRTGSNEKIFYAINLLDVADAIRKEYEAMKMKELEDQSKRA